MTPRAPGDDPAGVADRLLAAVAVVEGDVAELTDGELADALVALADADGLTDAWLTRVAAAFDARLAYVFDGARSTAGWLAARSELSRPRCAAAVGRGIDLRSTPHVDAAYSSGQLGSEKVRMLLKARAAFPERFAEHEADTVRHLIGLSAAQAATVIARWVALAQAEAELEPTDAPDADVHGDPNVAGAPDHADEDDEPVGMVEDREAAAGQPGSKLHLSRTLDGRVIGDLDLDPVDGADLLGRIDAWIDRRHRLGTYRSSDGLTRSQRQAQALLDLVARGDRPGTRHGDVRPSVTVTIDHRTLEGQPLGSVDDLPLRSSNLDGGAAVPRSTIERLLCTARIHIAAIRLRDDGTIETIGESDHRRHPTARQRRALDRRDRGCVFPGCDAPPAWCDAHHLIPYEDGGPTLLHNLALLCRHHHHTVHEGGWALARDRTGQLRLRRPDGTPVAVPPHGTKVDHRADPPEPPAPSGPARSRGAPGLLDPPDPPVPPSERLRLNGG